MLTPISSLSIEDDDQQAGELTAKLRQRGLFAPEAASNFDALRSRAKDKAIVSLDAWIDNTDQKSIHAAEDLLYENPSRPVYFLTHYIGPLTNNRNLKVFFLIEKKDETLENLDSIQAGIFTHHKCIHLAKTINQLSDVSTASPWPSPVRHVMEEVSELCLRLRLIRDRIAEREPERGERYQELETHLLPVCNSDSGQLVVSTAEWVSLSEPLLNFAVAEQESLLSIPGVKTTPHLEQTINNLITQKESSPSVDTSQDVERRYTDIDFPPVCKIHEQISLKIQIKLEGTHAIDLPFSGNDEVKLTVHVAGDGFDIPSDFGTLVVPRQVDSVPITFAVQPRRLGYHYLFINFYREATPVGTVVVRTLVEPREETSDGQ